MNLWQKKNWYVERIFIIINLTGQQGGGPFQSPPVTARGNVINITNPNNYPLGYFSVSEIDARKYTIQ